MPRGVEAAKVLVNAVTGAVLSLQNRSGSWPGLLSFLPIAIRTARGQDFHSQGHPENERVSPDAFNPKRRLEFPPRFEPLRFLRRATTPDWASRSFSQCPVTRLIRSYLRFRQCFGGYGFVIKMFARHSCLVPSINTPRNQQRRKSRNQ
jgi:hypothetical protein